MLTYASFSVYVHYCREYSSLVLEDLAPKETGRLALQVRIHCLLVSYT